MFKKIVFTFFYTSLNSHTFPTMVGSKNITRMNISILNNQFNKYYNYVFKANAKLQMTYLSTHENSSPSPIPSPVFASHSRDPPGS